MKLRPPICACISVDGRSDIMATAGSTCVLLTITLRYLVIVWSVKVYILVYTGALDSFLFVSHMYYFEKRKGLIVVVIANPFPPMVPW